MAYRSEDENSLEMSVLYIFSPCPQSTEQRGRERSQREDECAISAPRNQDRGLARRAKSIGYGT